MGVSEALPAQIGPYRILGELGRGGMGVVYRAHDPRLQRDVAIKVLRPELLGDAAVRARFLNEARSAARLQHPNLLPVYDVGEDGGAPYLVMRFIDGPDLATLLAGRGALPWEQAEPLLRGLAGAIDQAHATGVIHRDLKPANVLIGPAGEPLLTDFGIARAADASGRGLTQTGMLLGTPEYLSPEQAQGQHVDHRSDLYSFGVMAYEMLTGRVPYQSDTPVSTALAHVLEAPPDPRLADPALPPGRALALLRMLAKDPAGRYGSATQFVDRLAAGTETRAPERGVVVDPRPSPETPRRASSLVPLAVIAAALLLGGALMVFADFNAPKPPAPISGPPTDHEGWVTSPVDEAGAAFKHPPWPQQDKHIDSDGYQATRYVWHSPEDSTLQIAVETSRDPDNAHPGWEDLHQRLSKVSGGRYVCLAREPLQQNGARFDLWEYCLTKKDEGPRHIYKLGGWNRGYGVAVWGQCATGAWDRWQSTIKGSVGSFHFVEP